MAIIIESPCRKVCKIELRDGLCIGCHRTIYEIQRWYTADDAEKQKHFIAQRQLDAHAGEGEKICQSRSLLPVSSMKTSSREGVAISRLTSSLP